MQALVLSALKFRETEHFRMTADRATLEMGLLKEKDHDFAKKWIKVKFNTVHNDLFDGKPLYSYNPSNDMFEWIKE